MAARPRTPPTKRAAKATPGKPSAPRARAAREGGSGPEAAAPPASRREAGGTRERILAAAEEAFAAHGLRGARVQEIVARAGVNERMLYHHFGDKDGLYRAVLDRFLTAVVVEIEATLDAAATDPVERLRRILRRYFEAMATNPNVVRVFLHEVLAGWPAQATMKERRQEIDDRVTRRIYAFFTEAERAGVFREGLDPRAAMLVAGGACLIVPLAMPRVQQIFQSDLSDPENLRRVQDAMIDSLLQGVVASPQPKARRR